MDCDILISVIIGVVLYILISRYTIEIERRKRIEEKYKFYNRLNGKELDKKMLEDYNKLKKIKRKKGE